MVKRKFMSLWMTFLEKWKNSMKVITVRNSRRIRSMIAIKKIYFSLYVVLSP